MSTKGVLDAALGTATTCAFSIEGIGPGLAAALAGGEFLFDLLFPNPAIDPWTKPASRKDLRDAVINLKKAIPADIWQEGSNDYMDKIAEARKKLNFAIDTAGKPVASNHGIMGGDTAVWINGVNAKVFDPVLDASDLLGVFTTRIENHKGNGLNEITAYVDTVSLFLYYCRVGMAWEYNENYKVWVQQLGAYDADQKKIKPLQKSWDAYEALHPGSKHGPRPVFTVSKPVEPADNDPVEGSQFGGTGGGNISYRSHLGIKHSKFADLVRSYLPGYISFAKGLIDKWDSDWADSIAEMEHWRASVVVETGKTPNDVLQGGSSVVFPAGSKAYRWVLTEKKMLGHVWKTSGYWTTNKDLATLQAEMFRGQWMHVHWVQLMDAKGLAQFSRDDLDTLLKVVAKWQDVLDMYNGKTKGIDPKTGKPKT